MTERTYAFIAATAGALIGACIGYVFFTDRGRAFRRELDPVLDEFAEELSQFRGTTRKAINVANEGWRLAHEAFNSAEPAAPRYADPHQTAAF